MSATPEPQTLYPSTFEDAQMHVSGEPNVQFSFVVKAPKEYVFDAWNLPVDHGGDVAVVTPGDRSGPSWPGITNDMERTLVSLKVTQVVGNVQTPDDGDWHFEWKAGAPYFSMPFPLSLIMKSVHGKATLSEGPGPNETTVTIENRHRPGLFLWFTRVAIRAAMPGLSKAAPARFAAQEFVGPEPG